MKTLMVKDEINSSLAVTSVQAEKVYQILNNNFKQQIRTKIDFSNIETITTAFLNTAIGQLYSLGDPNELNKFVVIDGTTLSSLQRDKVRLVMENAKNKLTKEEVDKELNHGEI
ncbi:STAS-like domain-containing protein [Levilactobacillus brevis]|uniref:STAS-like domain-containing protein n=1 Tax=Levilactobacillus brevis TaxID=1580 RepID=UPI001DFE8A82|nr:STAS-like domain-containing protein [Levilactobacillus brevis]